MCVCVFTANLVLLFYESGRYCLTRKMQKKNTVAFGFFRSKIILSVPIFVIAAALCLEIVTDPARL